MILSISFLSALAGVGFAGAAALLSDTGVDGTPGAILALLGAGATSLAVGLLAVGRVQGKARLTLSVIGAVLAILTAVASWFLMQDALLITMVVTLLMLLVSGFVTTRKATA